MSHKLFIIFILLSFFWYGCAVVSNGEPQVFSPSKSSKQEQVKEIKISNQTLAEIKDNDSILPTFSLRGEHLAYSNVVVKDKTETTEIIVFDIQNQKSLTLLNNEQSEKYAVYAAFVVEMKWLTPQKLFAVISDGDVDSTLLTFDTKKGRILKKSFSEEPNFRFSPEMRTLRKRFHATFPKIPKEVLDSALRSNVSVYPVEKNKVILQYNYAKYDENVRLFNFTDRTEKVLAEIPELKHRFSLIGGFSSSNDILFVVNFDSSTKIYRYRQDKTEVLTEIPFEEHNSPDFEIKFKSPEKTLFLLKTRSEKEGSTSSLWLYEKGILYRVTDFINLYDFDFHSTSKLAAFSFWSNGERDISIKRTIF